VLIGQLASLYFLICEFAGEPGKPRSGEGIEREGAGGVLPRVPGPVPE
jgi:hypothetical protein